MAICYRRMYDVNPYIYEKWGKGILPTSKGNSISVRYWILQTAGTMGLLNFAMAFGVSSSISSILLFTNPLWLAF